jgi:hypothetical protein
MAKTWWRAIQKYGSLGAISFDKAFSPHTTGHVVGLLQNFMRLECLDFIGQKSSPAESKAACVANMISMHSLNVK